jgi:hypothetical protein
MKYGLNASKSNNYAFWDPQSRLHLTIDNPVGYADRVTVAIRRGLASKSIYAVVEKDGKEEKVFDVLVEEEAVFPQVIEVKKENQQEPQVIQEQKEPEFKEPEAPVKEEPKKEPSSEAFIDEFIEEAEKKPAKRGRKPSK